MLDPWRELVTSDLLDRLPAAVYVAQIGAEGLWLYVSPRIAEIMGYPASELLARPGLWSERLHPADREAVLRAEEELPSTGRIQTEYRLIRSDGQVVWILDDGVLAETEPYGLVQHGLLYDITSRKRTEMLLAEHADIVERVARGDDLVPTLIALAVSTEAISGVARCVVEVTAGSRLGYGIAVSSPGMLAADQYESLGPSSRISEFTDANGEVIGRVTLHYPDSSVPQQQDVDLAGWAASLATVAVVRANEQAHRAMSVSLLEATLESTADGILVVDSNGQIVGHNQKFLDMWQLELTVLEPGQEHRFRQAMVGQLVDPGAFFTALRRPSRSPSEASYDEVQFLDGRVFERYSQPQWVNGRSVGRVWSFRDMTLHRQLEEELREQAFSDPLTPLANRALFMAQLATALERATADGSALAVLLLDLDDFKTVNDSLGHLAGDQLLIGVAERLSGCLRIRDTAARLGGDEFVVLLENMRSPAEASYAADRILAAVSRPLMVEDRVVMVRASVGIATGHGTERPGDLLRNADLAMYHAKRDGGGQCRNYAEGMHAEAVARLEAKADLERAINSQRLIIHYQPVVDLLTGTTLGVEALVRWPHPTRGLIPPEDFIPLAEETRLIDRLGRWVLRSACTQVSQWRRNLPGYEDLTVSVNVSLIQLADPHLVEEVRQALWVSGLPPSALVLEITETSLASGSVDVIGVLTSLRAIGVSLALDDFGVGYSSLGSLLNYPLDLVKIDKSFLARQDQRCDADDSSRADLLGAVLQVAAALSLDTTIEGIETAEHLQRVLALGCRRGQGYLLSPPLSAAGIEARLAVSDVSRH